MASTLSLSACLSVFLSLSLSREFILVAMSCSHVAMIDILLAGSSRCVGTVISSVCDFVGLCVRTLKEKRLELPTSSSVHVCLDLGMH